MPPDERDWLIGRIEAEAQQRVSAHHYSLMQGLTNPKVLALSLVYFGVVACLYGTSFFLPQIIKQFGLSNANSILLSAVPYIVGVVASIPWGMLSDRTGNRRGLLLISLALAAVGTAGVAWAPGATGKLICLSVAAWGIYGSLPVFWTLPTAFLSGASAAGGIAIINALGNLSGYYGPSVMGYLKDRTGGFEARLQALGAAGAVAFLVVLAPTTTAGSNARRTASRRSSYTRACRRCTRSATGGWLKFTSAYSGSGVSVLALSRDSFVSAETIGPAPTMRRAKSSA